MNFCDLRKLVDDMEKSGFSDSTPILMAGRDHTYDEVRSITTIDVLQFSTPSHRPLGVKFHEWHGSHEAFGYKTKHEMEKDCATVVGALEIR